MFLVLLNLPTFTKAMILLISIHWRHCLTFRCIDLFSPTNAIRFLHLLTTTYLLTPAHIPPLLQQLRLMLFPNAMLPTPADSPPPSTYPAIKRRCAVDILALVPPMVQHRFFAMRDEEEIVAQVEEVLEGFSDEWCNKHLGYRMLELVVLRVVPELEIKRVQELMGVRGVGGDVQAFL